MLRFQLNGEPVSVTGVSPTTTLLEWLRQTGRVGTKEGCAEGDCGACTVTWRTDAGWRAVNACLIPLPSVHGREVLTVEGLEGAALHPAQQALVETLGSQCGYCTPGFVMSLFEACHRTDLDAPWKLDDQLCGNLCRCTGYRPIRDALAQVAGTQPDDGWDGDAAALERLDYATETQSFSRPATLPELWDAMDAQPDARLICGGTDLGLDITQKGVKFPALISLEALPLQGVQPIDGGWRVGATTRLSDLEANAPAPVIARMLRYFASRQIKNRATLGGNLCNASPIGDMAPVLLALNAVAVLGSRGGERRVPMDDFYLAYRQTAMQPGEVLVAVEIPTPDPATRLSAYKVSKRRELDISVVCGCFAVHVVDGTVAWARLAYGGMAATTLRATAAEDAMTGQPWTLATIERAITALDFTPLSDHRGSAWYRATVAGNLLRGFFTETAETAWPPLSDRPSGTVNA
jgi:xanthine dehydrogenase small subunit